MADRKLARQWDQASRGCLSSAVVARAELSVMLPAASRLLSSCRAGWAGGAGDAAARGRRAGATCRARWFWRSGGRAARQASRVWGDRGKVFSGACRTVGPSLVSQPKVVRDAEAQIRSPLLPGSAAPSP